MHYETLRIPMDHIEITTRTRKITLLSLLV